jgi:hypothetical protein
VDAEDFAQEGEKVLSGLGEELADELDNIAGDPAVSAMRESYHAILIVVGITFVVSLSSPERKMALSAKQRDKA